MYRRKFLGNTAKLILGSTIFPHISLANNNSQSRFFIKIVLPLGADASYLFDARPKAMTEGGMIQNYWSDGKRDAEIWQGKNGQKTFIAKPIYDIFKSKLDRLTIVNGVVMSPTFDGHEQNMNILFTGNPFGGEVPFPEMNKINKSPGILDFAFLGGSLFGLEISNSSASIGLSLGAAAGLISAAQGDGSSTHSKNAIALTNQRSVLNANLSQTGLFSKGARKMLDGLNKSNIVKERLAKLEVDGNTDGSDITAITKLALSSFKVGITTNAIIVIEENLDVHGVDAAKIQGDRYEGIAQKLNTIIDIMSNTPFDESTGKSFLDVTTFMVASEFSRTLRQEGKPIDQTGTDHNALGASILLGGAGIQLGQVIGSTDMQWDIQSNKLIEPSKAHIAVDQDKVKAVGMRFDFETGAVIQQTDNDETLDSRISITNIANTLFSSFQLPESMWYKTSTQVGAPTAKIIKKLLT